jgi:hypothetical protein
MDDQRVGVAAVLWRRLRRPYPTIWLAEIHKTVLGQRCTGRVTLTLTRWDARLYASRCSASCRLPER